MHKASRRLWSEPGDVLNEVAGVLHWLVIRSGQPMTKIARLHHPTAGRAVTSTTNYIHIRATITRYQVLSPQPSVSPVPIYGAEQVRWRC